MISGFSKLFAGLLGALLIALVGCEAEAPAKTGPNGPPPARVWVDSVKTGSIQAEWSFLGDVTALQQARLAAGASGEVRRVLVRVGDRVEQGALLVEIDPSLAAARVRAAEASDAPPGTPSSSGHGATPNASAPRGPTSLPAPKSSRPSPKRSAPSPNASAARPPRPKRAPSSAVIA